MYKTENRLTLWNISIAMGALFIGGSFGPLQKLEHAGLLDYSSLRSIGIQSYYHGLTIHGVLNALVWTTFFIMGFFIYTVSYSLKRPSSYPKLHWAGTYIMSGGLLLAAVPILLNLATVLFTFYPPMKASPYFYIGLALFIVGSWVHGWGMFFTYRDWRRENPKTVTPLIAMGSIVTMVMWQIATIGVAIEVLFMLIPFSLGWTSGTDPQLARTFFWFFGHPVVYFWLLPVYVSWYGMMPKQAGGKLFSDQLARIVFWLFLVLIPTGIHHQYTDPGIPNGWKILFALLTFAIFLPSMITAFTVIASLETGGRARGGTGLLGWVKTLPWGDASYTSQNLAMILFALGGISGITNASYNLNVAVHNTIWIPGHFHLTVGSAVTLSFFGVIYWMFPSLLNKPLWSNKLALWQAWSWFVGMLMMSNGLHILGLNFGVPRRVPLSLAPYATSDWTPMINYALVGGLILGASGLLFYFNIVATAFSKQTLKTPIEMPVAEPLHKEELTNMPAWLDTWRPWLIATVALIIVAYVPVFVQLISNYNSVPGFKVW
jgi:cytochrome c oxidase subunit I